MTANTISEFERLRAESNFEAAYEALAGYAYENARSKGFHDAQHSYALEPSIRNLSDATKFMLLVSEIVEAFEGYCRGENPQSDKLPEFSSFEEEMADVIIRIMDFGRLRGFFVGAAVVAKMRYNEGRPFLHGGKKV